MSDEPKIEPSERVLMFLAAERGAAETEYCVPPGLPTMLVKWFRRGLSMGAIVLHSTGEGYALATHEVRVAGKKNTTATQLKPCVYEWERLMAFEDRIGPKMSRELVMQRVQEYQRRLLNRRRPDAAAQVLGGSFE